MHESCMGVMSLWRFKACGTSPLPPAVSSLLKETSSTMDDVAAAVASFLASEAGGEELETLVEVARNRGRGDMAKWAERS